MTDLHWHALNFRTASSQDAHAAWLELNSYVGRECDSLRTINAELIEALASVVGCMELQRDVIERGEHAAAWSFPINAAKKALAHANGQA